MLNKYILIIIYCVFSQYKIKINISKNFVEELYHKNLTIFFKSFFHMLHKKLHFLDSY